MLFNYLNFGQLMHRKAFSMQSNDMWISKNKVEQKWFYFIQYCNMLPHLNKHPV